jgi:predicted ArsR family transcriptional regulator
MTGMTIQEIADALGISYFAARQRIVRARIEPISKEALYPEDTLERVRNVPGRGRPPKAKQPEPKKKPKK